MEKLLNPYDKEYMRLAMLKHEETFKEQVHELHRLYRIQKALMRNIENKRANTQQELWNSKKNMNFGHKSIIKLDLERPAEDYAAESSGDHNGGIELIDGSEIELTLGPSSYIQRKISRNKKPDQDHTPLTSDSGPSFSSSSTGSSHINRIQILNTKTEESSGGLLQNQSKTTIDNVDEKLRQERLKQHPWLFQVLSLNMT